MYLGVYKGACTVCLSPQHAYPMTPTQVEKSQTGGTSPSSSDHVDHHVDDHREVGTSQALSQGGTATATIQEADVPIEDLSEKQIFSWDGVMLLRSAQMSPTRQGDTAISTAELKVVCDTLVPFVHLYSIV